MLLESRAKGGLLFGASAIPVESILQNMENNIANKIRLSRAAQRFVKTTREERPHLGKYTTGRTAVEVRMLCHTSVQILLVQTWNLLARERGACIRT